MSDFNTYSPYDYVQYFTLTIEGIQYVWDEDDVVWRGGPPEGDHDDGFRKIGTLTYNDEDEEAMKQKLTTFVHDALRKVAPAEAKP